MLALCHVRTQRKEDHPLLDEAGSRFSADTECAANMPWDFPASKTSRTDFCCSLCCAQSWPTLCDPVDYNPPGSSVHGIFQARKLEWVAISFSRGSSLPWDRICVSYIAGGFFITEPPVNPVQFSSAQSCLTMDCSKPGFSVHYQLPELMQTHIH